MIGTVHFLDKGWRGTICRSILDASFLFRDPPTAVPRLIGRVPGSVLFEAFFTPISTILFLVGLRPPTLPHRHERSPHAPTGRTTLPMRPTAKFSPPPRQLLLTGPVPYMRRRPLFRPCFSRPPFFLCQWSPPRNPPPTDFSVYYFPRTVPRGACTFFLSFDLPFPPGVSPPCFFY